MIESNTDKNKNEIKCLKIFNNSIEGFGTLEKSFNGSIVGLRFDDTKYEQMTGKY